MKKVVVISLGGSQIIRNREINISFLRKFKEILNKNKRKYRFVVITGGGSIARLYINALKKINASEKLQNYAGISATRTNARFVSYLFGHEFSEGIPHTIKDVKRRIKKERIVFCGALEYHAHQTSDSTSAQIAHELKSIFINITNVPGLHTSNPLTNKNAKLIRKITWKDFHKIALKIGFKPGQHFVLDQKASSIIMKNKIKTYILGDNLNNLSKILSNKPFLGTTIFG